MKRRKKIVEYYAQLDPTLENVKRKSLHGYLYSFAQPERKLQEDPGAGDLQEVGLRDHGEVRVFTLIFNYSGN